MLPATAPLWVLRLVLLASLVVHVYRAVVLWQRAHNARTSRYVVKKNVASSSPPG